MDSSLLRIFLLGSFHVQAGSRTIAKAEWWRKPASLVKLLALAPRAAPAPREELLERLWPELGLETAANNLHRTLHLARRIQEPGSPFRSLRLNGKALAPPRRAGARQPGLLAMVVAQGEMSCCWRGDRKRGSGGGFVPRGYQEVCVGTQKLAAFFRLIAPPKMSANPFGRCAEQNAVETIVQHRQVVTAHRLITRGLKSIPKAS